MSINFPANPTLGQQYSFGSVTWTWTGLSWVGSNTPNGISAFANTFITATDSNYSWLQAGNNYIHANATSNNINIVAGSGITLFGDNSNNAIKITDSGAFAFSNGIQSNLILAWGTANGGYTQANSAQTLAVEIFASANQANILAGEAFNQANAAQTLAIQVYTQANLVFGESNGAFLKANNANAFVNVFTTNTDSGYTWTVAGNGSAVANNTSNILHLVSGSGINLYFDSINNAIRINASGGGTSTGATLIMQDSAPTSGNVANSTLWWQSNTGVLKVYYNDGNNSYFVDATALPEPGFGNIAITRTDSGYNWATSANSLLWANGTSNSVTFVGGAGVQLGTDAPNNAIRIYTGGFMAPLYYDNFNPGGISFFIAPFPCTILSIQGRVDTSTTLTATLNVVKAANGTAVTSGSALHTGSFFANGTISTVQILSLVSANCTMNAGDSLGVISTGSWTTSAGSMLIQLQAT